MSSGLLHSSTTRGDDRPADMLLDLALELLETDEGHGSACRRSEGA